MFKQLKAAFLCGREKKVLLVIASAVFVFSSCSPLKFSSVKYESDKVERARSAPDFFGFLLQYYSEDSLNFKKPYILTSYPINVDNKIMNPKPYLLEVEKDSKVITFKRKKVSGNLFVSKEDIKEVIENFAFQFKRSYSYLLFTPIENSKNNYISYELTAVGTPPEKGQPRNMSIAKTINPCPPEICFNLNAK